MIIEKEEIEVKQVKKKPSEEEDIGFLYNLLKAFKKQPEKSENKNYSTPKNPLENFAVDNSEKPNQQTTVNNESSEAVFASQPSPAQNQSANTAPNTSVSNNNNPAANSNNLSLSSQEIATYDFSNLTLGFSGITGNNLVGSLIAEAANNMLGIRETGGENSVPKLDRILNDSGIKGLSGNMAWCAKLTSAAAACAAIELDKMFGTGGKISKIFPEGASVLNIAEYFKNNNSLISPKEISNINPSDIIGTQLLLSRGEGGHTGIVTNYDAETGIITVVEGNLGKNSKTAEVKYNLADLISKGGTTNSEGEYKTRLIGFGDYNSLIKNADPELFDSLQKNNSIAVNAAHPRRANNPLSF
jgi:hypothetical protein